MNYYKSMTTATESYHQRMHPPMFQGTFTGITSQS